MSVLEIMLKMERANAMKWHWQALTLAERLKAEGTCPGADGECVHGESLEVCNDDSAKCWLLWALKMSAQKIKQQWKS